MKLSKKNPNSINKYHKINHSNFIIKMANFQITTVISYLKQIQKQKQNLNNKTMTSRHINNNNLMIMTYNPKTYLPHKILSNVNKKKKRVNIIKTVEDIWYNR